MALTCGDTTNIKIARKLPLDGGSRRGTIFEGGPDDDSSAPAWRNRLVWGDNLHVLASLADEDAGRPELSITLSPTDLVFRITRRYSDHVPAGDDDYDDDYEGVAYADLAFEDVDWSEVGEH